MLRLRRHKRVLLPVLAPSEPIRCTRLSATITVGTCVARWLKAQDRSTQRIETHSVSGRGDAGLPYLSCRDCAEGRARAQAASNDDGDGR